MKWRSPESWSIISRCQCVQNLISWWTCLHVWNIDLVRMIALFLLNLNPHLVVSFCNPVVCHGSSSIAHAKNIFSEFLVLVFYTVENVTYLSAVPLMSTTRFLEHVFRSDTNLQTQSWNHIPTRIGLNPLSLPSLSQGEKCSKHSLSGLSGRRRGTCVMSFKSQKGRARNCCTQLRFENKSTL